MSFAAWLSRLFIALAALLLAVGFWVSGFLQISIALVTLVAIALVFLWRGWGWYLSILLVLYIVSAAAGFYVEVLPAWSLLGALAILLAWDLEHFASRIKKAARVESIASLTRAHLGRLGAVSLTSLLLVMLTYLIQVRLTFGIAVLLALLAILGLSQGIAYLRRTSTG
jgi:hypothetical protein